MKETRRVEGTFNSFHIKAIIVLIKYEETIEREQKESSR